MHVFLLYEHEEFIAVYKPCGIEMHDKMSGIIPLLSAQFSEKLYLVHRLDKDTSGVLLLARSQSCAAQLSALFRERKINKHYIALSDKKPKKKQGLVKGDMKKSRNGSYILSRSNDNPAITKFNSQGFTPGIRQFDLYPQTGKTHQLRVALKSLGSPIIGDLRYGGVDSDRMYLHALSLQFEYKSDSLKIAAPLCEGDLWHEKQYREQLGDVYDKKLANNQNLEYFENV